MTPEERMTCRAWIDEAVAGGARKEKACEVIGLDLRRLQRWGKSPEDQRRGPRTPPRNKLTQNERETLLAIVNQPEYRDLPPKQIVPKMADQGQYVASESTIYRLLRSEDQLAHRLRSKPATRTKPRELMAMAPNQVWSWDISFLKGPIVGEFFRLYFVMDIFSRMIVGWRLEEREDQDFAAELIDQLCSKYNIDKGQLHLHSDNGGPMKGATMLATLQKLGVIPSFSRPQVSDDNPYSEALFRTLKYRPSYPDGRFRTLEEATQWVQRFVNWYNTEHLHSGTKYLSPQDRHEGRSEEILLKRQGVYEKARERHPERWSKQTRNWNNLAVVYLNPIKEKNEKSETVTIQHQQAS